MLKTIFYVFAGGGCGCVLRFLISKYTLKLYTGAFPVGTLLANILSCLLVALLVYVFTIKVSGSGKELYLLLVVGCCGGLSTFSTLSFETFELIKQEHYFYAILNVILSLLMGIGAMFVIYNRTSVT